MTLMSDDDEALKARRDAIYAVLREQLPHDETKGALVTRWLVIVESITPDGDLYLSRLGNEGLAVWDINGFAQEMLSWRRIEQESGDERRDDERG